MPAAPTVLSTVAATAAATNTDFSGAGDRVFTTTVTHGGQFILHSDAIVTGKFKEELFVVKISTKEGKVISSPVIQSAPYTGDTTIRLNSGDYVITVTGANTKYTITMMGM